MNTVTLPSVTGPDVTWSVVEIEHDDCGPCESLAHTAAVYARAAGSASGYQGFNSHGARVERSSVTGPVEVELADAEGVVTDLPAGTPVRFKGGRTTHVVKGVRSSRDGYRYAFTYCGTTVKPGDFANDSSRPACRVCATVL